MSHPKTMTTGERISQEMYLGDDCYMTHKERAALIDAAIAAKDARIAELEELFDKVDKHDGISIYCNGDDAKSTWDALEAGMRLTSRKRE